MKFEETLLYNTLQIPIENWRNDCLYMYLLKSPYLLGLLIIGVPLAIICDIYTSLSNIKYI